MHSLDQQQVPSTSLADFARTVSLLSSSCLSTTYSCSTCLCHGASCACCVPPWLKVKERCLRDKMHHHRHLVLASPWSSMATAGRTRWRRFFGFLRGDVSGSSWMVDIPVGAALEQELGILVKWTDDNHLWGHPPPSQLSWCVRNPFSRRV